MAETTCENFCMNIKKEVLNKLFSFNKVMSVMSKINYDFFQKKLKKGLRDSMERWFAKSNTNHKVTGCCPASGWICHQMMVNPLVGVRLCLQTFTIGLILISTIAFFFFISQRHLFKIAILQECFLMRNIKIFIQIEVLYTQLGRPLLINCYLCTTCKA